jgi:hypothetical protein
VRRRLGNPSGALRRAEASRGKKNEKGEAARFGKLGKHHFRCFFPSEGNGVAFVKAHRAAEPFGSFGLLFFGGKPPKARTNTPLVMLRLSPSFSRNHGFNPWV